VTNQVQQLDHAIIRFAGDSGDGTHLGGDNRFTQETTIFGNDLPTLPNFPAGIPGSRRYHGAAPASLLALARCC